MKYKLKAAPKIGELRNKSGFLFFPKMLGGEFRWLQRTDWQEVYHRSMEDFLFELSQDITQRRAVIDGKPFISNSSPLTHANPKWIPLKWISD